MFLLFLCLGTASVKAQVRIGGNTAPNAAAVLDLNATDATNNGTKGLALPRVNLTSNTMQLTSGVVNLTGILVYNTTATLGAGIYTWTGSIWKKVDAVPAPTPADSNLFLFNNGSAWVPANIVNHTRFLSDTLHLKITPKVVSWTIVLDTVVVLSFVSATFNIIQVPGLSGDDICNLGGYGNGQLNWSHTNVLVFTPLSGSRGTNSNTFRIKCYRPNF